MRVFEMQTATGSELFPLLTCPHTTTFTLLCIFPPLEMSSIKNWETIQSWHTKCSLPVLHCTIRISKTCTLKLPIFFFFFFLGGGVYMYKSCISKEESLTIIFRSKLGLTSDTCTFIYLGISCVNCSDDWVHAISF